MVDDHLKEKYLFLHYLWCKDKKEVKFRWWDCKIYILLLICAAALSEGDLWGEQAFVQLTSPVQINISPWKH